MFVRVHPAGAPVRVPQRDLASVRNDGGLAAHNWAESALQARLELRGHEAVVDTGLVQHGEVQLEEGKVDDHRNGHLYRTPYLNT